ncbi:MAG: DNA-directed RNA polymerase subunit beta [Kocuria sp.]|nr:DNA-directed RNA polymerase subunit beta [Kocuria sp.]
MSTTRTALFIGLFLGVIVAFGTFTQFLLVVLFGAVGLLVGFVLEGKLDLSDVLNRDRR